MVDQKLFSINLFCILWGLQILLFFGFFEVKMIWMSDWGKFYKVKIELENLQKISLEQFTTILHQFINFLEKKMKFNKPNPIKSKFQKFTNQKFNQQWLVKSVKKSSISNSLTREHKHHVNSSSAFKISTRSHLISIKMKKKEVYHSWRSWSHSLDIHKIPQRAITLCHGMFTESTTS